MSNQYVIQKETLDSIAVQSMNLAGKTEAVSTAEIISDLIDINSEVGAQADLIEQINDALEGKDIGGGGIDTSDATATASDIANGVIAYANGERIVGTINTYQKNTGAWSSNTFSDVSKNDTTENIIVTAKANKDVLLRSEASVWVEIPPSNFGDATAADVAVGKTFTSSAGLKIEGTHECSSAEVISLNTANNIVSVDIPNKRLRIAITGIKEVLCIGLLIQCGYTNNANHSMLACFGSMGDKKRVGLTGIKRYVDDYTDDIIERCFSYCDMTFDNTGISIDLSFNTEHFDGIDLSGLLAGSFYSGLVVVDR